MRDVVMAVRADEARGLLRTRQQALKRQMEFEQTQTLERQLVVESPMR